MEVEEFVVDVLFDVVRMPADELDELFMASGDGRREFLDEDGNRFGRGDIGAIGGAEVEFPFELLAKSDGGVSLLLLLLFSFGLCEERILHNLFDLFPFKIHLPSCYCTRPRPPRRCLD